MTCIGEKPSSVSFSDVLDSDGSVRRSGWQGQDIFRTAIPDSLTWFSQFVRSWLWWLEVFSQNFHQETTGCLACEKHLVERRSPDLGHRELIPLLQLDMWHHVTIIAFDNLRGQHLGSSQFFSFTDTCWIRILECNANFSFEEAARRGKNIGSEGKLVTSSHIQTSSNGSSFFFTSSTKCFRISFHTMPFLFVLYILHALIKARFPFLSEVWPKDSNS